MNLKIFDSCNSLTLPDSMTSSYQYDGAGRATQLTNPSAQVWTWTYLDNNWMSQQNANGQIITSPTRDYRGFVIDLLNRRTDLMQTTLSDYSVGFAANLTLGSITGNIPGAPTNFSGTNSYTHDAKL